MFDVDVKTTVNRGFKPEELAEQCVNKILSVSETAPEPLKQQAEAFRGSIKNVVEYYLKQAVSSDRTTVYNELNNAGQKELAELIRRL